jgi:anti-sigma factor RsiW
VGFAVAAAFVVAWVAFHSARDPGLGAGALVAEAVNDHLRVVQSSHPVEIESGGIHQVKPWFTGKLDFAPRVTFSGDDEFPLVGGSAGYFIDRKAAVMVFRHKLHTLTLLVLPRAGLPWPASSTASSRGFHLRFWQRDDLGFVLVSDASAATLASLGERLEGE